MGLVDLTTTKVTAVYVNAGRGPVAKVHALWGNVAKAAQHADVVVAVEVDEGDQPPRIDHRSLRQRLRGWRAIDFAKSREVIMVRPGLEEIAGGTRRAGRSVKHWSPSRPGLYGVIPGNTPTRIVTGHPAAGADTQAKNRPVAVRGPLQTSHDRTIAVMADLIIEGYDKGQNTLLFTDGNTRRLVTQLRGLLPRRISIVPLFDAAPDYGLAFPAAGQRVEDAEHRVFANPIEPKLHPGHVVTVTFGPA